MVHLYTYLYCLHVFHHGDYSIEIVEEWNVVATCSSDCAVRLWTLEGQYIGKACREVGHFASSSYAQQEMMSMNKL